MSRHKSKEHEKTVGRTESMSGTPHDAPATVENHERSVSHEETVTEETMEPVFVEQELRKKLDSMTDKYMRLLAEFDNFRKRRDRDIEEVSRMGTEKLIIELLPILDDLDRATEHKNNRETLDEYIRGIGQIEDKFRDVLARTGLEPIKAVGKPFDPTYHEALLQMVTEDFEPGTVSEENLKGYMLGGKVIRHSKVIVSAGPGK